MRGTCFPAAYVIQRVKNWSKHTYPPYLLILRHFLLYYSSFFTDWIVPTGCWSMERVSCPLHALHGGECRPSSITVGSRHCVRIQSGTAISDIPRLRSVRQDQSHSHDCRSLIFHGACLHSRVLFGCVGFFGCCPVSFVLKG